MDEDKSYRWMFFMGLVLVFALYRCINIDPRSNCVDLCASKKGKYLYHKRNNIFIVECICKR